MTTLNEDNDDGIDTFDTIEHKITIVPVPVPEVFFCPRCRKVKWTSINTVFSDIDYATSEVEINARSEYIIRCANCGKKANNVQERAIVNSPLYREGMLEDPLEEYSYEMLAKLSAETDEEDEAEVSGETATDGLHS